MAHFLQARSATWRATETLLGAIIGVGVFGLPFVFMRAGFFVGLGTLVFLGLVVMTIQLMLGEVVLQTPGHHRIPGLVARYFGKKWGAVAAIVTVGSAWGALVAYVLFGGIFMHAFLSPFIGGSVFLYQLLFLVVGFLVSLHGLRAVVKTETALVWVMIAAMLVIVARGLFGVETAAFTGIDGWDIFLPYGVVLFSLTGLTTIPELKDILGRYKANLRIVIPVTMVTVVALYALFAAAVVGVTGAETTPEAIVGLGRALGSWVLVVGSLFGFLAVTTSFIVQAIIIQDLVEFDYGLSRLAAWFAALAVPFVVLLGGWRDVIEIMGITGGVFGGLIGAFVAALYIRVRSRKCSGPHECFYIHRALALVVLGFFLVGAVSETVFAILR